VRGEGRAKIRAVVVDDEPLARSSLKLLLRRDPEVELVGECKSGMEALVIVSVSSVSLAGRLFFFPENNQCFVDQNSKQPTAKSAFIFELRRIARRGEPAALQSIFRFFITA
jgi:hypothetical protein